LTQCILKEKSHHNVSRDPNNKKEVLGHRNILALFTSSQKHTIINEISEIINNKRQRTS
jgi:chemotaxis methyl-accepting protein methylase